MVCDKLQLHKGLERDCTEKFLLFFSLKKKKKTKTKTYLTYQSELIDYYGTP